MLVGPTGVGEPVREPLLPPVGVVPLPDGWEPPASVDDVKVDKEVVTLAGVLVTGQKVVVKVSVTVVLPITVVLVPVEVVVVEAEEVGVVVGAVLDVLETEPVPVADVVVTEPEAEVAETDDVELGVDVDDAEEGVQPGRVKVPLELPEPPTTIQFFEHAASPAVGEV